MARIINRVLSALVAITYLVIGVASGAGAEILGVAAGLVVVLLFIWYSDEVGEGLTCWGLVPFSRSSPGWAVCLLAWLILLMPLFVVAMEAVYG